MTRAEVAPEVAAALAIVRAAGYVALKAKSYQRAQEKLRVAEALLSAEVDHRASIEGWAQNCIAEERRLGARLTHVYAVAIAHGATHDELAGDGLPVGPVIAAAIAEGREGHHASSAD